MKFISILIVTLIFICACNRPKSEKDCNFVKNIYGQRVSLGTNMPITLRINKSIPFEYHDIIYKAAQKWESSLGKHLFNIDPNIDYGPIEPRQDGVSIIYMMNTWESNKTNEQGRTRDYFMGNKIMEADILLNNKNFNFYIDTPLNKDDVHLESLFIHELGHVLGLKHNDTDGSVMRTYLKSSIERIDITDVDLNSLRCEY